jgi:NADH-quinone oxidoreductase subunit H
MVYQLLIDLIIIVVKIILVMGAILTGVAFITWVERRVAGFIQDRLGPNRVGPWGLFQPIADGIKLFFKEDIIPDEAYKPLYLLAPVIICTCAFLAFAVIPFGDEIILFHQTIKLQIADVNIGILYLFAILSLGVYGIILGGWSSNNKYSFLGALRSTAQMISYEIALGLSVIGIIMITGSLSLSSVIQAQTQPLFYIIPRWNIFMQPLGFLIFLIAIYAETNRLPFDLPEAEQELVAGYHTEYSSMKFALYYMSEYINVVTLSALTVVLFFGGWHIPGLQYLELPPIITALIQVAGFSAKVFIFIFLFIWVRWTFPRFRYDQLMRLGWLTLIPLGLANILLTGLIMLI